MYRLRSASVVQKHKIPPVHENSFPDKLCSHFPNSFLAIFHTSLALMVIYCREKSTAVLCISLCTVINDF